MTVSRIKVRLPTRFPSSVTADSPLVLDTTGGAYSISLDLTALQESLAASYQPLNSVLGTANEITATNGTGIITMSLPAALTFTGKTVTGGTYSGAVSYNKITLTPPATSATLTLIDGTVITGPAATGTLVTKTSTDVLTNKTFDSAGTGNVLQVSGVTVSRGQYPGESTTGSATAGNVGEYVTASILIGTPTALTSGVSIDLTSIALTAGDWDVVGFTAYTGAAGTTLTFLSSSVSLVSATQDFSPDRHNEQWFSGATVFATTSPYFSMGETRISVSGATTVYLIARANFGVSTCSAYGVIRARRVR